MKNYTLQTLLMDIAIVLQLVLIAALTLFLVWLGLMIDAFTTGLLGSTVKILEKMA